VGPGSALEWDRETEVAVPAQDLALAVLKVMESAESEKKAVGPGSALEWDRETEVAVPAQDLALAVLKVMEPAPAAGRAMESASAEVKARVTEIAGPFPRLSREVLALGQVVLEWARGLVLMEPREVLVLTSDPWGAATKSWR
jgi:hypothetical protein